MLYQILLETGRKAKKTIKMLYTVEQFPPSSEELWLLLEMLNTSDVHQRAKQMKIGNEWRNLSSKTKVSLSVKVLTHWEFPLGQFRAFYKTIRICDELPQNS
jgi:hypothetical protein